MFTQAEIPVLIIAAAAGCVVGVVATWWLSRKAKAQARIDGRADRDAEVVRAEERASAAEGRVADLGARLERFEQTWQQADRTLREMQQKLAAEQERTTQQARQLAEARSERDRLRERHDRLATDHAQMQERIAADARAIEGTAALIERVDIRYKETFQNLAQQILDERAQRLGTESEKQVGGLLEPLKQQLKEFDERIRIAWAGDQHERGTLAEQIRFLAELNQKVGRETDQLSRALKGDNRAQGAWGEMVLATVLKASGLREGEEFTVQTSLPGDDGRQQRPDVIVRLPENRQLVIDAKVSLVAWDRMVNAADDGDRDSALREHLDSLRRHIDGLSARDYASLAGLHTVDFVLMFVPIEAAFVEAVRADEALFARALDRKICLVCPSTLLATLRTVDHIWKIEQRNRFAAEIAMRGARLHDNFRLLVDEIEAIGVQLDKADKAQKSAMRRLTEGGKGSVLLQVESLKELGVRVKHELPGELLLRAGGEPTGDDGTAIADSGDGSRAVAPEDPAA